MVDLSVEFCGAKAPNPFWLASGPPTNSEYQVRRAFDAGWGEPSPPPPPPFDCFSGRFAFTA